MEGEGPGYGGRGGATRGWSWVHCPGRLLAEEGLRRVLRETERGMVRRDGEGMLLALPWAPGEPFPIPPLFCLARVQVLEGTLAAVFRFDRRGWPVPQGPG